MKDAPQVERFMILGSARTGSNLLTSMLSAHPSTKMYGELFNLDTLPRNDLLDALEDPIAYLQQRVYRDHGPQVAAVGFKMFYDHLTDDYFRKLVDPSVAIERLREKFARFAAFIEANYDQGTLGRRFRDTWDFLIADRRLRVVHLKRRNILDTLISYKTAFMTGQWWTLKSGGQPPTPLRLDPEECRVYFEKLDTFAADADAAFASHPKLEVAYEDLVARPQQTVETIFAFVGVPPQPVSTRMKKQILSPAAAVVENYGELKESFRHTRWSAFFD